MRQKQNLLNVNKSFSVLLRHNVKMKLDDFSLPHFNLKHANKKSLSTVLEVYLGCVCYQEADCMIYANITLH